MVTAVPDTAVNATDDVTATTAVLNRETTALRNQASDPSSWLLTTLAPGESPGVSQITTTVTPTGAPASTPNAVVQVSLVTATVSDDQTPNVVVESVISPSGTALVVTDRTIPATDTVMTFINKVSPSTRALSLMTEAVARAYDVLTPADDVIASAMDYAAPTTLSASLATDEVAQMTNEMNGTIIPAGSVIALATKIVPLLTDAITLDLDDVIENPGAATTTKAEASTTNTPLPDISTVPPLSLPVNPGLESAEPVPSNALSPKPPSPDVFNLEALKPDPNALDVAVLEAVPPDGTLPEVASLPEASKPKSPAFKPVAPEGPPQFPTAKSNSFNLARPPEELPLDVPSMEASATESPPLDAVGPKATPMPKAVSLPDVLLPNTPVPISKAKPGKTFLPPTNEKEKPESSESRHKGKSKGCQVHSINVINLRYSYNTYSNTQDKCKASGHKIW